MSGAAGPDPTMRILVVEDDPDLAAQLKAALTGAGYAVDVAADGEEGHFLGDSEPYDAVVLDLGLPQVDGLTVIGRWRRAGRRMPVLVLTASPQPDAASSRRVPAEPPALAAPSRNILFKNLRI